MKAEGVSAEPSMGLGLIPVGTLMGHDMAPTSRAGGTPKIMARSEDTVQRRVRDVPPRQPSGRPSEPMIEIDLARGIKIKIGGDVKRSSLEGIFDLVRGLA